MSRRRARMLAAMTTSVLVLDDPLPGVRRLTLNRPEKRNALNNELRGAILAALRAADADPAVKVSVLRGAGPSFSSGYDLSADNSRDQPFYSPGGPGQWARHVVEGCFRMWDLATPIIAQVHGWCLAGGSELAVACDLVYVAEDAQIGYPAVRTMSPPDNQYHAWLMGMRAAMELMLTGDAISGTEAVRLGFANRAFAAEVERMLQENPLLEKIEAEEEGAPADTAGTLSKGLLTFDRQSRRWTATATGLPSMNVTALAADRDRLYVGTDNGLVRIRP